MNHQVKLWMIETGKEVSDVWIKILFEMYLSNACHSFFCQRSLLFRTS